MRVQGVPTRTLLAVFAVLAVVLAGCAPAEEPIAEEPVEEEPETDQVTAEPDDDDGVAGEPEAEAVLPGEGEEITAYVVAYHWGFALFDEDGAELEQLEVPKGATVELVAVNDHASAALAQLPAPVAEAIGEVDWHERAHHDVRMGRMPDPEQEEGIGLSEALEEAHARHHHELDHHGLMVQGTGERVFLDSHASEPERMEFVADREGPLEFRCTEECGFGHDYQRWEMVAVTA